MKASWSRITLPAAIAAMVIANAIGTSDRRPEHSNALYWFPQIDTVASVDSAKTAAVAAPDTVNWDDEDTLLFGDEKPKVPLIMARDTMKVPDSLKLTDPFLYKWYVAVKDSFTHRIVIDSLKAAGDSIDWPVIDSLYLKDSAATAKARFDAWYASLSKRERRKYDYEQALPAKLHRMDSILNRKDSLKKVKDSITEVTPRILDTYAIPDSLHYKRFISWKENRLWGKPVIETWDTTFNYHFHDYPFQKEDVGAAWLGVAGSPVETWNYFKRKSNDGVSWYTPYESWTYSPETLPMFNTKTPYTELSYYGTLFASRSKESDNIRIFTTQNILPQLNLTFEFKRYGGKGILSNESTTNKTLVLAGNWLGRKHVVHGGYIRNKVIRSENGGIQDNFWIRDTTVDAREINVFLSDATNTLVKNTVFLDQTYRIPFNFINKLKQKKDTTLVADSLSDRNITTAFIGHSSDFSVFTKTYTDGVSRSNTAASGFFNDNFFINPNKSADSLRTMKLENRVFFRLQPWKDDAIVSKIEAGVGDRLLSYYMFQPSSMIRKTKNVLWNSAYVYAGAEGRFSKYITWDATGSYTFVGKQVNDMYIGANASFSLYPFRRDRSSPISLKVHFHTALDEPDYFQQHFYSNHYVWENDFSKVSTTKVQASFEIPRWRLNAYAGYAILKGNIYYDTQGIVRQNGDPMSVLTVGLQKDFTIAKVLHLDHDLLFQLSSNQEVVPLPMFAARLRYYVQFNIVRPDVMKMQIGLDARYNTPWYAPAYNPVSGTFYAQNEYKYGNCVTFDAFVNLQWKRACVFFKFENAGQGWPMKRHDYFSAHHYISTQRAFKFGIYWPFYVMSGRQNTLSSKAGSGFGGGGGGGGLGGALGGGLGGLKSGFGGNR